MDKNAFKKILKRIGKGNNDLKEKQKRLISTFEMEGKTVILVDDDEDFIKRINKVKNIRLTVIWKNRTEFLEKIKYKNAQVCYANFIDTPIDSSNFIFIKTDFNAINELENNMLYAEKNMQINGQLVLFNFSNNDLDINLVKKVLEVKYTRIQFVNQDKYNIVICIKDI